jgi:hypothetical protein
MGTSKSFGGQGNNTPLVPDWLDEEIPIFPKVPDIPIPEKEEQQEGKEPKPTIPPNIPPLVPAVISPNRFRVARKNFTHYASSNGSDGASFGRAISHYVTETTGGAQSAAKRMGTSRKSGKLLLGFLSSTISVGAQEALKELDLEKLTGLPIEGIFLGMIDYICPDGGAIDEGIARDAFIETIADLVENGITDLNTLNYEQMQTVFELYVTHTIVNRLYNDIGTKAIQIPSEPRIAIRIQLQIEDFIRRGVSDALIQKQDGFRELNMTSIHYLVNQVYEDAFMFLQNLGDLEESRL